MCNVQCTLAACANRLMNMYCPFVHASTLVRTGPFPVLSVTIYYMLIRREPARLSVSYFQENA